MPPPSELWIGLVEIKPLDQKAYGAAGAFTRIVTWACDVEEYKAKAATIAATLSMFVFNVENALPLIGHLKTKSLSEELEDMVIRAESNTTAIIYGTFHRYPFNEA